MDSLHHSQAQGRRRLFLQLFNWCRSSLRPPSRVGPGPSVQIADGSSLAPGRTVQSFWVKSLDTWRPRVQPTPPTSMQRLFCGLTDGKDIAEMADTHDNSEWGSCLLLWRKASTQNKLVLFYSAALPQSAGQRHIGQHTRQPKPMCHLSIIHKGSHTFKVRSKSVHTFNNTSDRKTSSEWRRSRKLTTISFKLAMSAD